jgi:hypothetical protein
MGDLVLLHKEDVVGVRVVTWLPLDESSGLISVGCIQVARVAWFAMRWGYSKSSPLSPSTEFVISQNHVNRILRIDICWGVGVYVLPVSFGVAVKFRMLPSANTTYHVQYPAVTM